MMSNNNNTHTQMESLDQHVRNLNLEGVEGVELEPFATLPLAVSYFL